MQVLEPTARMRVDCSWAQDRRVGHYGDQKRISVLPGGIGGGGRAMGVPIF